MKLQHPFKSLAVISTLAVSVLATAAGAHDFWVQAPSLRSTVDQPLTLDLRVGHPLEYESVERSKKLVDRFVATDSIGERDVIGREGGLPAGFTRSRTAGPLVVAYAGLPQPLELEPVKFEAYLAEEGLEAILAWRKENGESQEPGRERYARCAKTLIEIEVPEGKERTPKQRAADRELRALDCGLKLELFWQQRNSGEESLEERKDRFQLQYEGKPVEGVLVRALHLFRPSAIFEARTDKHGHVAFPLGERGPWLVKAVHMVRSEAADADWDSYWASLLLELPAAESSADSSK